GVDKDRIKGDPRLPLGVPSTDNANYLWIQYFASSLNKDGRAGFVMANSAGDARSTELEIRRQLIQSGAVDVIVSVGSNFFYTVTLPCTLWFFDAAKTRDAKRKDTVLFLDARTVFRQLDRAHRDFTPEQIEYLANIVRLYRGLEPEFDAGSKALLEERFPELRYADVAGLCKAATLAEIEAQGWSLNPGRYVGVGERPADEFDFAERLAELNEELGQLSEQARQFTDTIGLNVETMLGQA
ncbi:MAG: N-6 DNA methylase, partial [Rhodanobacteraceae bacterium]